MSLIGNANKIEDLNANILNECEKAINEIANADCDEEISIDYLEECIHEIRHYSLEIKRVL